MVNKGTYWIDQSVFTGESTYPFFNNFILKEIKMTNVVALSEGIKDRELEEDVVGKEERYQEIIQTKDLIMANMRSLHRKQLASLRELLNDVIAEKIKLTHEVVNLQLKVSEKDFKILNLKREQDD